MDIELIIQKYSLDTGLWYIFCGYNKQRSILKIGQCNVTVLLNHAYIEGIFIYKELRGQNYGRVLIENVLLDLYDNRMPIVTLCDTSDKRRTAESLYVKVGFKNALKQILGNEMYLKMNERPPITSILVSIIDTFKTN